MKEEDDIVRYNLLKDTRVITNFMIFKQQIVDAAQRLTRKGYLMATGGNLSVRIPGQNAFAIIPSNYDYFLMTAEDICVLNFDLKNIEGDRTPSIESGMHNGVYQTRGDVNAVNPYPPGLYCPVRLL